MTLLEILVDFCAVRGYPQPSQGFLTSDARVRQLIALSQRFLTDMLTRKKWQVATASAQITSVATQLQGDLSTICPGFMGIVPDTFFDKTNMRKVEGGMTDTEWGWQQARLNAGPLFRYAVRNNQLYLSPQPPAAHVCIFDYYSRNFVLSGDGTRKPRFTADTDTCIFGDELLPAYLLWAFKKENGLEYAQDFATYETLVDSISNKLEQLPSVSLSYDSAPSAQPGIFVPAGSWSL